MLSFSLILTVILSQILKFSLILTVILTPTRRFRRGDERPFPPVNFAGDYAGGAVMLVMGVLLSVIGAAFSRSHPCW